MPKIYRYTVKHRWTQEELFKGNLRDCCKFIHVAPSYISTLLKDRTECNFNQYNIKKED